MARRDDVLSRGLKLWTVFCLMLCSLGFAGSASGATFTVTNTNDSGTGSLRQAITDANNAPGSTINFVSSLNGQTITLTSAPLPAIGFDMTITGPGASSLTVSGNNSSTVGTIFTINTGVTASISGLTIANGNGNSSDQGGGGILNDGTLTVSNCTISGNSGTGSVNNEGGGITNFGTMTVSSSTFSGNTASLGGGIFNGDGNTLTVTNSTFSGNSATTKGGGIYDYPGGTLAVTNSTISGNSASEGGGIETNSTTTTITNSIVAGNTATAADDIDGTFTDGGGNLIGTTGINLAPLGNYGGPTQTMLPLPNSPAICAGTANSLTTDQRGFPVAGTTGGSTYCTSGKIDSGAVQTNYTAIQFTNKGTSGYAAAVNSAVSFPAAPIVSVTESGLNQGGVPVTLTFDGMGTATGLGPVTTVAGIGATFSSISVSEAGSDTLSAQLTPGSATLNASANLKVVSITLSPTTLPNATQNTSYSQTITASGGSTSSYTYAVTSGALPAGLSLGSTTGTVSGTPTAATTATFTITATDGNGFTGSQSYTLTVNPPVTATQAIATKVLTVNQPSTSFTPVTGSGGTAPLSYSISPSLPASLSISSSSGTITGIPTAASAATTYTVTVTDVNGSKATATFSLTVNAAVVATQAVATKVLTVNQPSTSFTPVTGSGGTAPLSYSISPSLPAGLNISSSSGTITGVPTAASAATTYTVTVTDVNGSKATATFSLTVNPPVTTTAAIPTELLTVNQTASFTPVTGSGGTAPLTFSISPSLSLGLSLNPSTGTIAGTPTATSPATSYTVTVTDSNQATATATFSLTVNAGVTATTLVASTVFTQNQPTITPFTPVNGSGGTTPYSYAVAPSLPGGLSMSSASGTITGMATVASPTTSYTVTVTDKNGSTASSSFSLTVNPAVVATQKIAAESLTQNQPSANFTPVTGSGGTGTLTYSISPSLLPMGLSFSTSTGAITGTPTAASAATTYTVTVTDSNHATNSATFLLTVSAAVTATLNMPTETLTIGQPSVSFTPVTGTGGTGTLTYSISPAPLPTGLSLNSSTGAISGSPTAVNSPSTTTYTVTVTDSNQATSSKQFVLILNSAVMATTAVATTVLTDNHAAVPFVPVNVSGGTTPFSYSVSPALPAGLTLNTSTGVLSGTPTVASPAASYTVTVTDHNHATSTASFSLTVSSAVMATTSIAATMLTVSQSPASFMPVTGSGGTAPLVYSISPAVSAGLSFSSTTGTITGTPTAASAQTVYTVTVTDGNGATATASFSLTVNSVVTATTVNTETLTVNQVTSFTPVTGSGGTAPLRYSISPPLPMGLTLNTSSGAITGTQTAISAATTYTVTVTDVNQVMTQANFTLTVTPATTSVSVTSSSTSDTSTVNDSVTFTAKVTPYSGTMPIPPPYPGSAATVTGSVSFTDNGSSICSSPVSVVSGIYEATCTTSSLQAATSPHTILAAYIGNSNYNGSNDSVTQTVTPAKSSTALLSSPNPSVVSNPQHHNDTVTLKATVMPSSGSVPLSGKVAFTDGGNTISGCSAVSVVSATGVALCTTTFMTGGSHTIIATYGSDLNYSGSSNPKPVTQSVQDFSLGLTSNGQVTVTHGFTNSTDPVSPQQFDVMVTSIQGYATASGNAGTLSCTFTILGAPSDAVLPTCPTASLTIPPPDSAQTVPMTIDATSATPGSYSLVVTGVDPTTGLSRSTPQQFTVYVSYAASAPVTVASGATTETTFNFTLPAGVVIPINCNYAIIAPSNTPVPTSTIPIGCTLSVATIGSASSTTVQSIPVTVTANTGSSTTQLVTQTNIVVASLLGVPVLALIGLLSRGKRPDKSFLRFLSIIFILAAVLQSIGCGGSFNRTTTATNTTPAGTYYLLVQGPGTENTKQPYQAVIGVNVIR